jgi:uncharacterized membrane protein
MESRVKLLGHPIHPMLIVFPLGLLSTAAIFDIIALVMENAGLFQTSFWMIVAGVIGGLAAAVFGTADWLAIPRGTRARRIGQWHGLGNVAMVTLFAASWALRRDAPMSPPQLAVVLSVLGLGLGSLTGWLGGELVDRLGVGVDEGANLDAPSSLSERPAHGTPMMEGR